MPGTVDTPPVQRSMAVPQRSPQAAVRGPVTTAAAETKQGAPQASTNVADASVNTSPKRVAVPSPDATTEENPAAPAEEQPATNQPPVRATVRGQSPDYRPLNQQTPGSDHWRQGMPVSGWQEGQDATQVQPAQYQEQYRNPNYRAQPGGAFAPPPPPAVNPGVLSLPELPPVQLPSAVAPPMDMTQPPPGTTVPWDIFVEEARTGQFMVGVGVNSDAGVTGQIILDERNFDWTRVPTSWDDVINGTAFRGAGQGFRMEAVPGNQVQRYLVSFTEPYLMDTQISLNLSGFFYDRRYFDWDEQRLGGRVALGYRLTPDLSFSTALRMEEVNIHDPRVLGVPELDAVLGDNALYSPRFTLTHDTRDIPFLPTEGHFIELAYEQVFGDFDYPRGEVDYRKYFLIRERPDGSGRHTLSYNMKVGFSGSQTPLFENYFAGGYSTLRGFDFRGASPVSGGVRVGGEFRFLGAVEYMFPLTADDMIRGVAFVDFGTVEEKIDIEWDDFRVAPGMGLRISIPALGPAPIALDFAVPVAREDSDDIQNFSFFFGFGRN